MVPRAARRLERSARLAELRSYRATWILLGKVVGVVALVTAIVYPFAMQDLSGVPWKRAYVLCLRSAERRPGTPKAAFENELVIENRRITLVEPLPRVENGRYEMTYRFSRSGAFFLHDSRLR